MKIFLFNLQNGDKTDGMAQDAKFGINLDILSIFVSLNAF